MVSLVVWDHNTEHQALKRFLQISPVQSHVAKGLFTDVAIADVLNCHGNNDFDYKIGTITYCTSGKDIAFAFAEELCVQAFTT